MGLSKFVGQTALVLVSLGTIGSLVACQKSNPAAPDAGPPDVSGSLGFCVSEINRFRATLSLPPLSQSDRIADFSNEAARIDGEAHEIHRYFRDTNGGSGTVRAENEIPWWNLNNWGSVRAVVQQGLAQEWAEGPGGSHYENIRGTYNEVACGISINDGEVTVTQDFH